MIISLGFLVIVLNDDSGKFDKVISKKNLIFLIKKANIIPLISRTIKVTDGKTATSKPVYPPKLRTNYLLNNAVSIFTYLFTFLFFYYLKTGSFVLDENYFKLFWFFAFSLVVGDILSNKFILTRQHELWQTFRKLSISLILSLGFLSILLLMFNLTNVSRVLLLKTVFSGLLIEYPYYFWISERRRKISLVQRAQVSLKYLLIDGILLSLSCYYFIIKNVGFNNLKEEGYIVLAVIYFSWLVSASTTHKFHIVDIVKTKWEAFALQVKFYLIIISIVLLSIYLLNISQPVWGYFVEAIAKYSVLSLVVAFFIYGDKIRDKFEEVTSLFLKAYEEKEHIAHPESHQDSVKYRISSLPVSESVLCQKLHADYLKGHEEVFNFLARKLDLKSFDLNKVIIRNATDSKDIEDVQPQSCEMIINLNKLNDFRRINHYLFEANNKLIMGGVIVGTFVPNRNKFIKLTQKYPFLLANVVYFIDFIWNRMFPRLPLTRHIYFLLNRGKNRSVSLAEGLGRLVYSNFRILDIKDISSNIYFIAAKEDDCTFEKYPNHGPLFKMKRVGKGGKIIYVYKFRTMHLYSEHLQDFVYLHNKVKEGGKFKDDFRIPGWGKFFRSTWIDELPMIYNLIKGDLKLVGVRPISKQYMSLYSNEHQKRRIVFKPGLIPPYYADMPKTIEEIELSEQRYFNSYEKNPIITDVKYLFKSLINIIFKEKRSS